MDSWLCRLCVLALLLLPCCSSSLHPPLSVGVQGVGARRLQEVYQFQGNPFERDGPLSVGTKILEQRVNGVPVYTEVFYPSTPGRYTPLLFIPGFNGAVYPSFYSVVSTNLASYGYVVASIDLYWPTDRREVGRAVWDGVNVALGQDISKTNAEKSFQLIQWLQQNLVSKVLPSQDVFNVTVDWSNLGLLCHSSGGDTLVRMLQQNTTFAQAVAFLEPFSNHLPFPLSYSRPLPSLSYGTQFCMEFPTCCIEGMSYTHFYNNLFCPKILMEVKGYGHCDILDEIPGWELCHESDFCKTTEGNNRHLYREVFIPGLLASFFGQYLQGNPSLVKLITNPDLMPIQTLQLLQNTNCVT